MKYLPHTREEMKCNLAAEVLRSFGELHSQVRGASMLPTLWPRDRLSIQSTHIEQVLPGDLVIYARHNRCIVHRVIEKSARAGRHFLITRGDATQNADPPVYAAELLGRVVSIQRCGSTMELARKLTVLRRLLAMLLCRCDLLRGFVLRLHDRTTSFATHQNVHRA